jgi:hypothetical protein
MPKPADIRDPAFRSALEEAERLLDDGDYSGAARTCAETYLRLLDRHPELLPPADLPDMQPSNPEGQPRVAEGPRGLAGFDSARAFRRKWWPVTGAINVVVGPDRTPQLKYVKERVSLSEATGYFEFLLEQVADTERTA